VRQIAGWSKLQHIAFMQGYTNKVPILCRIFVHKMFFDTSNAAGPSHCSRCSHKEEGIKWPRSPEEA